MLKVQHRLGCAQADKAASENSVGLRIHEMAVIPPGYNTGTVFLNGWRLRYQNGDHHVRGLGSAIFNITQTQNGDQQELHWEAGGVLGDDGVGRDYLITPTSGAASTRWSSGIATCSIAR